MIAGYSETWNTVESTVTANKSKISIKRLLIDLNAAKATETMVLMGRMFTQTMKTLIILLITPVLRLRLCESGCLPARIRRIRKDR